MKLFNIVLIVAAFIPLYAAGGQIRTGSFSFSPGGCGASDQHNDIDLGGREYWSKQTSTHCETSGVDSNGNGAIWAESSSSMSFDSRSGEIKMSSGAVSAVSGNTRGYNDMRLYAELFFGVLEEDTPLTFYLNIEGILETFDPSTDQAWFRQTLSIWDRGITPIFDLYKTTSLERNSVFTRELYEVTYMIPQGRSSIAFFLDTGAGAIVSNTGSSSMSFGNTSWFNISLGDSYAYASSIPGFLTNPKDNIGMAKSVSAPSRIIFLFVFGLIYLAFRQRTISITQPYKPMDRSCSV